MDKLDYLEPTCPLCDGKKFYEPDADDAKGSIPLNRIIEKEDALLESNQTEKVSELLSYWLKEAEQLNDKKGVLGILSEQIGHYRKIGDSANGLAAVEYGLKLIEELSIQNNVSGATILLNCATTLKSFGKASESIPIYEKVSKVYETELPPNDKRKAGLYNNMALALVDIGEYKQAEQFYYKAIAILNENENSENEIAITYMNLAHLYDSNEEIEKINDCLTKAIKFLNSTNIERNGYHAYVCSKCAPSFGYFGYDIVKNMLEKRAKEIYERN